MLSLLPPSKPDQDANVSVLRSSKPDRDTNAQPAFMQQARLEHQCLAHVYLASKAGTLMLSSSKPDWDTND